MSAATSTPASPPLSFLSKQVSDAAYYYLDLNPSPGVDLAIVCGGVETCLPDYSIYRPTFRYHSFEYVAEGRGELDLAGRHWKLRPGTIFSYRPGMPHRITSDAHAPLVKYFIDFTGSDASDLLELSGTSRRPAQLSDAQRIRDLFDELERTANAHTTASQPASRLLLRLLALRIAELRVLGPTVDQRAWQSYQHCRSLIDHNCEQLMSLTDVAAAAHTDASTICRLFQRFADTTPYRYLMRRKMNRAAELLQHADHLIKEVATLLGFDDPFHFSRTFKRIHGTSPRRFIALSRGR